jgi:surfactin synthase thioesterase subunit
MTPMNISSTPPSAPHPSLIPWNSSAHSDLALVCIPWAGAGAAPFRAWGPVIGGVATVYGVRLPGRENRPSDAPAKSLAQVVDEMVKELAGLGVRRIALFGQCSGALLALELAEALSRPPHDLELTHLVVASQLPPSVVAEERVSSTENVMQYVPEEFREEPDLLEILLPVIAGDVDLVADYHHSPGTSLKEPITVVYGARDELLDRARIDGWRMETTGPTNFHEIAGGDHLLGGESWLKLARLVRAALT